MQTEKKKSYESPKLVVHGNVEELTQATWRPGSGDILTEIVDIDTACNPRLPGLCDTSGS